MTGCTTNEQEQRRQAILAFQDNLRASWAIEDDALGYRDIRVEDSNALAGLSAAELGRFLELYRDRVRLIPVFSFRHDGRHIEILQGYRGRGQYAGNTGVYQTIETPFHDHREHPRIYRNYHAFVFIDGRLGWVLDQSRVPDIDRIAIEAWTEGAAPYQDGFSDLMTRLQTLRLDGPVRFARFVNPPDSAYTQRRSTVANPLTETGSETTQMVFAWPQGWLRQSRNGFTLEQDEINRLSTYPGDLRAVRVGDPLPHWPEHYEHLPERYELVQRFPVSAGYELIGIKVTPSFECTPYGNSCGYIGDRRFWVGIRGGVVDWIDIDLPPNRESHLHALSVRDRVCAFLRTSDQGRQRYCL